MKNMILMMVFVSAIFAGEAELKKAWATATAAGKKGNWTEAARLYAQAFEANGDTEIPAEFFYDYGDALTGAGNYKAAIDEFERALSYATLKRPDLAAYNIACSYSRLGDFSGAKDALYWAVYLGYKNIAHLEKDDDLAKLRSQPNWPSILANLKAKKFETKYLDPKFPGSIAQFHKALKSKNEAAIMEWVIADSGAGFNRSKLLAILNQARNLAFRTPVIIGNRRGLAEGNCRDYQCSIDFYEKPLGSTGGSTHTFVFMPEHSGKEPHYKLHHYECAGGCEP